MLRAVLWDFGGVLTTSPFDAFNRYEAERGLPKDYIRSINARNPHTNAWARLERSDISPDQFDLVFAEESEPFGHRLAGADVLGLLTGDVRPEMVAALDAVKSAGLKVACLTNNVVEDASSRSAELAAVYARFEVVVESSKVGVRKPEPRFYEIACELLAVEPSECVFLDDLGINLKPAAAMGIQTIKVTSPAQAIADLSAIVGIELR
jgi:putative hydrolase of the HAD superfamily